MTSIKGCDFISRSLTGKTLAAAGYVFCARYTLNAPGGSLDKQMSRAEIVEKSAAGVRIVNNFEWSANPPDSRVIGKEHAQANKAALARLDAPDWMTYYSIDTGLQAGSRNNYAKGWRDVYPADQLGVYTCGALFRQLKADGYVTKAWQSMSRSFPGNHLPGQPDIWDHRGADVIQTGGVTIAGHDADADTAVVSDYGGWLLGEEDPNMALTKADLDLLFSDPRYADMSWRIYGFVNMLDKYNAGTMVGDTIKAVDAIQKIPTTAAPAAPLDPATLAAIAKAVNDELNRRTAS